MKKIQIEIGHDDAGSPICFDVTTLIKTRLLICANSGGGKSWLLRRIIEQLSGILPTIVFDVEGEFATLREKFDFVLVGPGGETPADCRSAGLVIQKLLELRTSAVIDLSELSVYDRHRYMKLACEAAINSPKTLWRPTCFVFDEAHEFCPESSKGQSDAKAAVLAFATKGRKRQFLSIFATQRLHKLAFDCRAELLNRMIGQTFEPDDLKVAREILGVSGKEDVQAFNKRMRTMGEGKFFGFGRAISLETVLVKVGKIQTSHGVDEVKALHAPPPPANIRALLPKLADLPQQAEEKAKTEEQLRADVRRLTGELAAAKAKPPDRIDLRIPPPPKEVRVPLISQEEIKAVNGCARKFERVMDTCLKIAADVRERMGTLDMLASAFERLKEFKPAPAPIDRPLTDREAAAAIGQNIREGLLKPPAHGYTVGQTVAIPAPTNGEIRPGEVQVLTAIAQNAEGITREHISVVTGYKQTTRKTYLALLQQKDFIFKRGDLIFATAAGLAALGDGFKPLPTGIDLVEHWLAKLEPGEKKVFEYAIAKKAAFRNDEELEAATGYKGTTRKTYIARLVARHVLVPASERGSYQLSERFLQ